MGPASNNEDWVQCLWQQGSEGLLLLFGGSLNNVQWTCPASVSYTYHTFYSGLTQHFIHDCVFELGQDWVIVRPMPRSDQFDLSDFLSEPFKNKFLLLLFIQPGWYDMITIGLDLGFGVDTTLNQSYPRVPPARQWDSKKQESVYCTSCPADMLMLI